MGTNTDDLTKLGREVMHRRRRLVVVAVTVALLTAATLAIVAGHGQDDHRDLVQVRAASPTIVTDPTGAVSTSATREPSTVTTTSTTSTTSMTSADATVGAPSPGETTPTTPAPTWSISQTTGLTDFATVTIHAWNMPQGAYEVGQCPPGVTLPLLEGCQLSGRPSIVNPVNGEFTSTVRVQWWMSDGKVDCGSAPGACLVGFKSLSSESSFVPVGFPISFDPTRRPTITVTPDQDLADGQSVVVSGTNAGVGTLEVEECLLPRSWSCATVEVPSDPDGTFSASVTVHRLLAWSANGVGDGSGTCGVDDACVVRVLITSDSYSPTQIYPDQQIDFGGPATAPSTTTPPG